MCGFVGLFGWFDDKKALLEKACEHIRHRGPDSEGQWISEDQTVGLAHVRLAIQDLSIQGHQPMHSENGRFVLVFNGEIYNHLSLRECLPPQLWRGHSDTETLLACFAHWGVSKTLEKLVGMFAFALWDKEERKVTLGRDRFGEKPLYYAKTPLGVACASDLKALMSMKSVDKTLNRQAITLLMRHNYIPAPYSIFEHCYKLLPSTYVVLEEKDWQQSTLPDPVPYWSAYEVAKRSSDRLFKDDQTAIDAFESLARQAVKDQMLADVKLGAFLSGGTDSSLIVALMQAQSSQAIKTFSIGFTDAKYDEAPYASAVANHLGTEHTELYMDGKEGLSIFEQLPQIYSEPFADSSQLPTVVMMGLTAQHVKVALSGDAGDELFGGYQRYQRAQQWWDRCQKIPSWGKPFLAKTSRWMSEHRHDVKAKMKWQQLMLLMQAKNSVDFYLPFVSYWKFPSELVIGGSEPSFAHKPLRSLLKTMMMTDSLHYLPDDILVKVDRAAMYHSLETRVPLLDHRIFEFVWDIHPQYKRRDGVSKWLMKETLYRHVPKTLLDRPKKGFSVPLGEWLKGPMKTWVEDLLSPSRLNAQQLFQTDILQQTWQSHLAGKADWSAHLWGVLMLQAWIDEYDISVS